MENICEKIHTRYGMYPEIADILATPAPRRRIFPVIFYLDSPDHVVYILYKCRHRIAVTLQGTQLSIIFADRNDGIYYNPIRRNIAPTFRR